VGRLGERVGKPIPQTNWMRVPVIYTTITDARNERLICGVSIWAPVQEQEKNPSKTILHVFGRKKSSRGMGCSRTVRNYDGRVAECRIYVCGRGISCPCLHKVKRQLLNRIPLSLLLSGLCSHLKQYKSTAPICETSRCTPL
jgi:hypothetical protein